jgi:hypothetical protein
VSGVSITESGGGLDLDSVVAGGPALLQRLADFKEQRDGAVKALADLQLGREVAEARDVLARDREAWKAEHAAEVAKLGDYINQTKTDVGNWQRETTAKTMADRAAAEAARAAAEAKLSAADQVHADAQGKLAEADDRLLKAKAAQAAVAAAQAALAGV